VNPLDINKHEQIHRIAEAPLAISVNPDLL
jgi:hypothetical protein